MNKQIGYSAISVGMQIPKTAPLAFLVWLLHTVSHGAKKSQNVSTIFYETLSVGPDLYRQHENFMRYTKTNQRMLEAYNI